MALAIAIFGASGSGKTMLMESLAHAGNQYSIHIKGTDRPPRKYDDIEIRCVSSITDLEYDYIYQTYGYRYGLQRKQIDEALSAGRHHFVICNDIGVLRALKRDFGNRLRVVFQLFDAPRAIVEGIQLDREISDDEIELRLAKIEGLYRQYLEEQELFDEVLINHYGDPPLKLRDQMEKLLAKMVKQPFISFEGDVSKLIGQLKTQLANTRGLMPKAIEPGYAFIMMAMIDSDSSLVDIHEAIKRACNEIGVRAERVDDTDFTGQITEKVLNSIRIAEYVIADLTHERPNVYYEIGYADALGKPLILTARRGTKIHFDLRGMHIILYDNLAQLEISLKKTVKNIRAKA